MISSELQINLIGDIAFTGILSVQPGKNTERFANIFSSLRKSDMVFTNLEVPVKVDNTRNEHKNFIHFSLPDATAELLKILNVSCVSLANNHIYDCKMSGLKATISLLDGLGIRHTGAGWEKEHIEPVIINKSEIKIGFIAYVDKSTNPKTESFPELLINYFDAEKVKSDVKALRNFVDKIICSIHWGVDYSYYPTKEQVKIAREIIDSGADIIMGHHPHTFQPFEKYKNGFIFYSFGSFTFGDYIREEKTELQALFRKTKKSAIVNYFPRKEHIEFISIKELKGNFIVSDNRNYIKWSDRKWIHYKIKYSSEFTRKLYDFNEKVIYRIYEYFFGYYKNPIVRLFQFSNLKKFKKLFCS